MRAFGGPTIASRLDAPANGFAIIRLGLALAVVVSHGFSVVSGQVGDEPLQAATGFTLGEHAVNGFFAVSGFLVTMSLERRGARDYAISRALRILPGFVVATLVVGLAIGGALTTLPFADYLRDAGLWRFVTGTLTAFKTNVVLPGVFPDNPLRLPMGTVWTLKYEVICYAGLLALGLLGLLRRRWAAFGLVAALALAILVRDIVAPDPKGGTATALRLVYLFALGGALYVWRDRVRASWAAALVLVATTLVAKATPAYHLVLFTAEAYAVLALALSPALGRPWCDPPHDLSYGVYLYGWPLQQALRQLAPSVGPLGLLAPSLVLALAVAAVSWFLVERPALRLKARTLGRRTIRTIEPAAP